MSCHDMYVCVLLSAWWGHSRSDHVQLVELIHIPLVERSLEHILLMNLENVCVKCEKLLEALKVV